jgi:hypothetical protein
MLTKRADGVVGDPRGEPTPIAPRKGGRSCVSSATSGSLWRPLPLASVDTLRAPMDSRSVGRTRKKALNGRLSAANSGIRYVPALQRVPDAAVQQLLGGYAMSNGSAQWACGSAIGDTLVASTNVSTRGEKTRGGAHA